MKIKYTLAHDLEITGGGKLLKAQNNIWLIVFFMALSINVDTNTTMGLISAPNEKKKRKIEKTNTFIMFFN